MPLKHNAARRHRIPRARYRVTNWPAYEAGLRRQGDLTVWVDEAALAGWQAPRRSTPGGQPRSSELAIELVLTLRLMFHLALRQAEGFARSVLQLLGVALPVPDHTTLSRRGRAFAGRQPRVQAGSGPMHLVLDSTGLGLFGQGEWRAAKHGRLRRRWLKLHLGVDTGTGEIAAHVLTDGDEDDAAQAPALLRQCEGTLASVTADGASTVTPSTRPPLPDSPDHRLRWSSHLGPMPYRARLTQTGKAHATVTSRSWPSGAASAGNVLPDTESAIMRKRRWAASNI